MDFRRRVRNAVETHHSLLYQDLCEEVKADLTSEVTNHLSGQEFLKFMVDRFTEVKDVWPDGWGIQDFHDLVLDVLRSNDFEVEPLELLIDPLENLWDLLMEVKNQPGFAVDIDAASEAGEYNTYQIFVDAPFPEEDEDD